MRDAPLVRVWMCLCFPEEVSIAVSIPHSTYTSECEEGEACVPQAALWHQCDWLLCPAGQLFSPVGTLLRWFFFFFGPHAYHFVLALFLCRTLAHRKDQPK